MVPTEAALGSPQAERGCISDRFACVAAHFWNPVCRTVILVSLSADGIAGERESSSGCNLRGWTNDVAYTRWPKLAAVLCLAVLSCMVGVALADGEEFRPPAVPLVTIDPYTSCWSMSDKLSGDWPRHWTGRVHAMCGFIRVDGKPLRFMGSAPASPRSGGPDGARRAGDAKRLSIPGRRREPDGDVHFAVARGRSWSCCRGRPTTSRSTCASADDKPHAVRTLFRRDGRMGRQRSAPAGRVGPAPTSPAWTRCESASRDQRVLATKGDNVRIDWGYVLRGRAARHGHVRDRRRQSGPRRVRRRQGRCSAADDAEMPRAANDRWPVLAVGVRLGHRRQDSRCGAT